MLLVLASVHSNPALVADEEAVSSTPGLVQDSVLVEGVIDAVGGEPIFTASEPGTEEQFP